MGISVLSEIIYGSLSHSISKDLGLKDYSGKIIAMDASQYLYQSMAPLRSRTRQQTASGTTSPLLITFNSIVKLLENGIRPVYVFDGTPPKLKSPTLQVRREKREVAMKEFKVAEIKGDVETMERVKHKVVKVSKPEVKSCKGLLKVMGVPYYFAPGEAEAQCAAFVEAGRVYATATQDMDALTFGTKVVLRHLPLIHETRYSLQEIRLEQVLTGLGLSREQLIDLCILVGCDYCKGVTGLGAHRAVELIHKHGDIETVLEHLDRSQYIVPNHWLFKEAREVFLKPKITSTDKVAEFRWKKPDEQAIVDYLLEENQFDEQTVRNQLQKVFEMDLHT